MCHLQFSRGYKLLLLVLGIISIHSTVYSQNWITGATLHLIAPSNIGTKESIGFNDVAQMGYGGGIRSNWFYRPNLSLGAQVDYSYIPMDKDFWYVRNYGEVKNNYQIGKALINARIVFREEGLRPFAGIGFGAYWLHNSMIYTPAYDYQEVYQSFTYTTNEIKPGVTPEIGFLTEVNKNWYFEMTSSFSFIPGLEPEVVYYEYNGRNYPITQNAHGAENHWSLSATLYYNIFIRR